jgi:hypothetical protein
VGFNISGAGEIDETSGEVDQSTVTGGDYTGYALSFDVGNGVTTDVVGIKSHGVNNTYATEHEVNWGGTDYLTSLEQVVGQIEKMEDKLKVQASKLANNLAVITQREDFTEKHISILQEGADKLTLADLNEKAQNSSHCRPPAVGRPVPLARVPAVAASPSDHRLDTQELAA